MIISITIIEMEKTFKNFEHHIKNEDITTSVLKIISDLECIYFNARKIRFNLYDEYGINLRGRPCNHTDVCTDLHLKMILSSRIGHITRKLKKHGYIEKFNNNTWKRIKDIDINDPHLQSK